MAIQTSVTGVALTTPTVLAAVSDVAVGAPATGISVFFTAVSVRRWVSVHAPFAGFAGKCSATRTVDVVAFVRKGNVRVFLTASCFQHVYLVV